MLLDGLPSFAVVQLHPVVLPVFHLARALQGLGEEVAEVVVVGGVFESKVSHICEVLVEFLCDDVRFFDGYPCMLSYSDMTETYLGSDHRDP